MTSNPSSPASPLEEITPQAARYERYVVGCDLGQSHDPTAVAVVRRIDDDADPSAPPIFQVGHLERLPLGTPYPGVVRHVSRMLGAVPLRGKSELVIDFTGVGRPVFDMFQGHCVFADRRHDHGWRFGDARGHDLPCAEAQSDQPRVGAPA